MCPMIILSIFLNLNFCKIACGESSSLLSLPSCPISLKIDISGEWGTFNNRVVSGNMSEICDLMGYAWISGFELYPDMEKLSAPFVVQKVEISREHPSPSVPQYALLPRYYN